jgi:hypothetical protein
MSRFHFLRLFSATTGLTRPERNGSEALLRRATPLEASKAQLVSSAKGNPPRW